MPDEVDYTSEALSALVGSSTFQAQVVDFNRQVNALLVALGSLRVADSQRSELDPHSMKMGGEAIQRVKEVCGAIIDAGEALRQQMRAELGAE